MPNSTRLRFVQYAEGGICERQKRLDTAGRPAVRITTFSGMVCRAVRIVILCYVSELFPEICFHANTTKIQAAFAVEGNAGDDDPDSASVERNVSAYSQAASKFSLGFAVGSLLFGVLADVISIRWLYPIVVVVWSIAGICSGMTESVLGLATSRFVLGLFESGHWPCALRTTQRTFLPAKRTAANSILQSGASIGAVLTPLLVLAVHRYDEEAWRFSFFLVGAIGIPWAIAWLYLIREPDVRRPVIQTNETDVDGDDRELVELPLLRIFFSRRWWLLLLTVICINTVWQFIRVWMTDWLENFHGYSHAFTNKFTSAYFLCSFFGSLASGSFISYLANRNWHVHHARMLTFFLFSLMTALVVPASMLPPGRLLLSLLLIVAFGSLGLFPVYYSLCQELTAKHQGTVGGSLGFCTWFTLSFFHEAVGDLIKNDPEWRTVIFSVVGIAPCIAAAALQFGWGTRSNKK